MSHEPFLAKCSGTVTVLIPTIFERAELLEQALDSVRAQSYPVEYRVGIDRLHNGPARIVNELASDVRTEWIFRLDDDDLLDPDHFEVLSHWLLDDYDIVFTWCRVEGGGDEHPEDQFQVRWQSEYGWEHLNKTNWIPCSAAIRTDLFLRLGGLRDTQLEDWDFWKRALAAGARFACVPCVTWTYRMNPEWSHRNDIVTRNGKR
jgi:hypothetical protein